VRLCTALLTKFTQSSHMCETKYPHLGCTHAHTDYMDLEFSFHLTQFPRVSGEGQLGDPTPPGWPL